MTRRTLSLALLVAALVAGGAATAQDSGVVLYERTRLSGERIGLGRDTFDLNETAFGTRRASSVDVARGCRATLFELSGYRGASVEVTGRIDDLAATRLGRRAVASVRITCAGSGSGSGSGPWSAGTRGVTLLRDARLEGESETFTADVPDLSRTLIGARQASSIEVPEGCVATLFTGVNFSGRSTTFRETHDNLRLTDVGNDTASSLRVDCGRRPRNPRPVGPRGPAGGLSGVTLYRDKDFRGESESFRSDVPDLSRTRIGGRQASSIEVPPGCRATLFGETSYRGRSATFDEDHDNLRETPVGNDAALSMRVVCSSRGW